MHYISIDEAAGKLRELLREAQEGERVILTSAGDPVAVLTPWLPTSAQQARPWRFGCMNGKITISDDFDEPLEEFREYM